MHACILQIFNKYLLCQSQLLDAEDTSVTKTDKTSCSYGTYEILYFRIYIMEIFYLACCQILHFSSYWFCYLIWEIFASI